jgi:hypothetical protein
MGAAIIPLLFGCASTPIVLHSVGPAPAKSAAGHVPTGCLRVYTATDTHEIAENTYYYPHTGYRIYTADGKLWKYVPNHAGDMDESVTTVRVPEGNYRISAQSEAHNFVCVPVVILGGQTTEVHLGTHWKAPANARTNQLVYLPGRHPYPVGWKSSMTE